MSQAAKSRVCSSVMVSLFDRALGRAEVVASAFANTLWPHCLEWAGVGSKSKPQPNWAPAPLQKTRSMPPLGWPRRTDSLCPECVKEVRASIVEGKTDWRILIEGHPGEIPADIIEQDGRILMVKECPKHGRYEDTLSIDSNFMQRIESQFPGRDFLAPKTPLRNHGTSTIKYGRGSVLTVDLTNRCNMMCEPCFMDANQVGYVHELDFEDIKKILDDAVTIKPRRQLSVQFSGGEPTMHPCFLDAVAYARKVGYFCVQCATNGIEFAQDVEFCHAAKRAGLRLAYLQFDGTSNEAHRHRKVGNLFDVKQRAIDNLYQAGIDVVLVVTVVRGINDGEVGKVVKFAIDNAEKVTVVSFQPISFTGRDENVSDEKRLAKRYTLSHLAHDMKAQLGITEPMRDWVPLSAMNPFSDFVDLLQGPDTAFGSLNCGCHPNCGIGTILLVNKVTKQMVPLAEFLNIDQLLKDVQQISDKGLSKPWAFTALALSVMRNFRSEAAPKGYHVPEIIRQMISQIGVRGGEVGASEGDANEFPWRFLFVAGMWFQDLWTYDFRRTEMCIIPYGTQMGEISFCAYNTGVGWRQIVEKMFRTATTAEWYKTQGRHPIYAKGRNVPLDEPAAPVLEREFGDKKRRLRLVG